jgi:hypothetical protein
MPGGEDEQRERSSRMHALAEAKDRLGPWDPIGPSDAVQMFEHAPFWWAVGGGWAIDMFLGRQTRYHHDLDIAVARHEQGRVFETLVLLGWDCHIAASGQLTPWRGERLATGENNIWCRRPGDPFWRFDLVMTEIDDGDWVFRRNPRVRLRMDEAITVGSPSFVSPQVQLLFKARHRQPKDEADLAAALPQLDRARRRWLHDALRTSEGHDHPWVAQVAASLT